MKILRRLPTSSLVNVTHLKHWKIHVKKKLNKYYGHENSPKYSYNAHLSHMRNQQMYLDTNEPIVSSPINNKVDIPSLLFTQRQIVFHALVQLWIYEPILQRYFLASFFHFLVSLVRYWLFYDLVDGDVEN